MSNWDKYSAALAWRPLSFFVDKKYLSRRGPIIWTVSLAVSPGSCCLHNGQEFLSSGPFIFRDQ